MKKILILACAICCTSLPIWSQAPGALLPPIVSCFSDANGKPYAGGFVYAYQAFTNTPQNTYTDSTLGIANTNPVSLDAGGCAPIWLSGVAYDIELRDSNNASVRRTNNVSDVAQILYSQVVLLNPVSAALQTIIGPLGATSFVGTALKTTSTGVRVSLLDPITTLDTATNTPTVTTTNPASAAQNYTIPDPGVAQSHFVLSAGPTNTLDCSQAPLTCIKKAFFYFEGAGCNNSTSALGWDTFGNNGPGSLCLTGTNIQKGVLTFPATISFVQQNTGNAAASTTVTTTYPATTTVGDLLIASVVVDTSRTVSGCTDGTNAYTKAVNIVNGALDFEWWYFNGSSASKTAGTTLTCTLSAAGNAAISWLEYSGNSTTGGTIIGVTATATGSSTAVVAGTTTIDGNALILSGYGATAAASPTSVGSGSSVPHFISRQGTNVQTQNQGFMLSLLGGSLGRQYGFTLGSSQTWAGATVTILPPVGAVSDITAQRTVLLPPTFTTTGTDVSVNFGLQFPFRTELPASSAMMGASIACSPPGGTDDPPFNAVAKGQVTVSATTNNILGTVSIGPGTLSAAGCAAGSLLHLRIHRIRTDPNDGYEQPVYVTGASFQFQVNQ